MGSNKKTGKTGDIRLVSVKEFSKERHTGSVGKSHKHDVTVEP